MKIEGAVLVGGASRRMGTDKAELMLGDQRVVDRLRETLRPLVTRVRLVGRSKDGSGSDCEPDRLPGRGPLGGIHTALKTAREEAVLIVGCDLPFVSRALLEGLIAAASETPEADAVVACPSRGPVPVCAIYRARCLAPLQARLESGALRATDFVESLNLRRLGPEELKRLDPEEQALFNMNDPSDYETARAIFRREKSRHQPPGLK